MSVGMGAAHVAERAAPRRYASPLIAERRSRILSEAKQMIGEGGLAGFTLRDLGRRAGVSVTTIYNAFGDREGVVYHALSEFHSGIRLSLPTSGANLAGVCAAIAATTEVVIANRTYSLALADLYFSSSLPPSLFAVIRGMPLQIFSHWLWLAERDAVLRPDADPRAAEAAFANLEWGSIKDWSAGRVSDASLASVRAASFLTMAASLCVPDLAVEAADLMSRYRRGAAG